MQNKTMVWTKCYRSKKALEMNFYKLKYLRYISHQMKVCSFLIFLTEFRPWIFTSENVYRFSSRFSANLIYNVHCNYKKTPNITVSILLISASFFLWLLTHSSNDNSHWTWVLFITWYSELSFFKVSLKENKINK